MDIIEVVQKLSDGNHFVAIIDGNSGTTVVRGWTSQPINWFDWAGKIKTEYIRLTRRGISPARAAFAARQSVMAVGPSNTPFIERMTPIR